MEHDLQAEGVAQVDQAGEAGQEEAAEHGLAHDRPDLRPEIVADEEDVDRPAGRFEDAPADLAVIIHDPVEGGVDDLGRVDHQGHEALHAEEVDGVVEERRPVPAQDGVFAVPAEGFGPDAGDVHPVGIGPGEALDVGDGRGARQRMGERLAVAVAVPLDAEGRAGRGLGMAEAGGGRTAGRPGVAAPRRGGSRRR